MSVDELLQEEGIELDHRNTLPKGVRTTKDLFARVIHTVRMVESSAERERATLTEHLAQAERDAKEANLLIAKLQDQVKVLEEERRKLKQQKIADEIESLSIVDKRRLLDVS